MAYEKTDVKLVLVKFGVAVALSFAGFIYSRLKIKGIVSSLSPKFPEQNDGDESKHSIKKNGCYPTKHTHEISETIPVNHSESTVDDFNEVISRTETEASVILHLEQEIIRLKNSVKDLENKKLEFYALKEQQATISHLQNRLNLNNKESRALMLRLESLLEDNRRLNAQVADHDNLVAELETAREVIITLTKKLNDDAKQNQELILTLQDRVSQLLEQQHLAKSYSSEDFNRMNDLEDEADTIRRANWNLQQENDLLAQELGSVHDLPNSIVHDSEDGIEVRNEHEELVKRLDGIQNDRAIDADELARQRSVNACLRHELQKLGTKAKQLVVEVEDRKETFSDLESCVSFGSESFDSDQTVQTVSSCKTTGSRKSKFIKKLKGIVSVGKDKPVEEDHNFPPRSSRRMSASNILTSRFGLPPTRKSDDFQRTDSNRADNLKDTSVQRRREQEALAFQKAQLVKFAKLLKDRDDSAETNPSKSQKKDNLH